MTSKIRNNTEYFIKLRRLEDEHINATLLFYFDRVKNTHSIRFSKHVRSIAMQMSALSQHKKLVALDEQIYGNTKQSVKLMSLVYKKIGKKFMFGQQKTIIQNDYDRLMKEILITTRKRKKKGSLPPKFKFLPTSE